MGKPDSQQRGLAGEYYVAFVLSRLGYDVSITIGRAKILDLTALAPSGKSLNVQVKTTYAYYDWLVKAKFDTSHYYVIALVRLGKDPTQKPELYFLPASEANKLIDSRYPTHSPRINRAKVQKKFQDHDFELIEQLLQK
jgi:hypothetical protein